MLLAYVDHHDKAYAWAARRRIEAHPKTGAVQIVEVRERVEEIAPPAPSPAHGLLRLRLAKTEEPPGLTYPFAKLSDDELLSVGVPADWLADIRAASEDAFLELSPHLPAEAAESLLQLPPPASSTSRRRRRPTLTHTPTRCAGSGSSRTSRNWRRRSTRPGTSGWFFSTLRSARSSRRIFLAPGASPARPAPARPSLRCIGPCGSPNHRPTPACCSRPSRTRSPPCWRRRSGCWRGRRQMSSREYGLRPSPRSPRNCLSLRPDGARMLPWTTRSRALENAAAEAGLSAKLNFLRSEWAHVVDAWQVTDAAEYIAVPRLGRDRRLGSKQREKFWPVFAAARASLEARSFYTLPGLFTAVTRHYAGNATKPRHRRGARPRRPRTAFPRRDRPAERERSLLLRRSRPAHFSAALLLEGARRRRPRPRRHAQGQLSNIASNPPRRRSPPAGAAARRRRGRRGAQRDGLRVQRAGGQDRRGAGRGGRNERRRGLHQGGPRPGHCAAGDRRFRARARIADPRTGGGSGGRSAGARIVRARRR